MRHLFIPLSLIMLLCASCSDDDKIPGATGSWDWLTSDMAFVSYGLIAGISLRLLLRPLKKSGNKSRTGHKPAGGSSGRETDHDLEQQYYSLEAELRVLMEKNRELQRQLAETKQFLAAAELKREHPNQEDHTDDRSGKADDVPTQTLYFLQPARDGRFKDSGKVGSAAEALYVLTISEADPEEALLQFVDRPANVLLAIQNETTWILPACERSNIPSEATRSIRTDIPGRAVLRSGEWEVMEKARITYV